MSTYDCEVFPTGLCVDLLAQLCWNFRMFGLDGDICHKGNALEGYLCSLQSLPCSQIPVYLELKNSISLTISPTWCFTQRHRAK